MHGMEYGHYMCIAAVVDSHELFLIKTILHRFLASQKYTLAPNPLKVEQLQFYSWHWPIQMYKIDYNLTINYALSKIS